MSTSQATTKKATKKSTKAATSVASTDSMPAVDAAPAVAEPAVAEPGVAAPAQAAPAQAAPAEAAPVCVTDCSTSAECTTTAACDSTTAVADSKTPMVSCEALIEQCIRQAQTQIGSCRELVSCIREVKRAHDREMRGVVRANKSKKSKKDVSVKQPTGFAKPCHISDELADFLHNVANNADVVRGMEMSRTDATRRLNEYFVSNNLRDTEDKRTILYEKDPKLVALFGGGITKGQKLTYFNLQSVLKDKFAKPVAAATPATPVATPIATDV